MAIVYRHIRLDKDVVFYVGVGTRDYRAFETSRRSKLWKNINKKTDILVEILYKDISYENALELESFLIEEYGRIDLGNGNLANHNNGGGGSLGHKRSEDEKKRISEAQKGKKFSDIHILNLKKAAKKRDYSFCQDILKLAWDAKRGVPAKNAIRICDIETGIVYSSITEAAKQLNLNRDTIGNRLRKNSSKSKFKYCE